MAAFFAIGHLAGEDGFDLGGGHLAAVADAGALDGGRGGDDEDEVDAGLAAGFEEEGDVEDGGGTAGAAGAGEEAAFGGADQGVEDAFQGSHGGGVLDGQGAEGFSADGAVFEGSGEGAGQGGDGAAAFLLEAVDFGVCVEDGEMGAAESARGGGLAHADAAREADYFHPVTLMGPKGWGMRGWGMKGWGMKGWGVRGRRLSAWPSLAPVAGPGAKAWMVGSSPTMSDREGEDCCFQFLVDEGC